MSYKVAIVEDEELHRNSLESQLRIHSDLDIVGCASSVHEAHAMITSRTPDLVFMDVILPPLTSFDLIAELITIPFEIIFTTSFEEFAVKAFKLAAVDYLIKPIDSNELKLAIDKFKHKRRADDQADHISALMANLQASNTENTKIALPTLTGYLFVKVKDIIRCESDNTYTTFHTTDKRKIVVSRTLKECEHLMSNYNFYRIHNSHLINLEYISEYIKGEGGVVKMCDGSHVDVSRRRKEDFINTLRKA